MGHVTFDPEQDGPQLPPADRDAEARRDLSRRLPRFAPEENVTPAGCP